MSVAALLTAGAAVGLLSASAQAVPPAVDEYTLRLPNADGKGHVQPTSTAGDPSRLPPGLRAELDRNPDGATLIRIATAVGLGAPANRIGGGPETGSTGDQGTSPLPALARAAGGTGGLVLLALLAGATATLIATRGRARQERD